MYQKSIVSYAFFSENRNYWLNDQIDHYKGDLQEYVRHNTGKYEPVDLNVKNSVENSDQLKTKAINHGFIYKDLNQV